MIDQYDWSGGREAMLRFGPATGPVVLVALPLFEEANRLRAFAAALCRILAKRGVASVLPDMPGQGESAVSTEALSLGDLDKGHQGCVGHVGRDGRPVYAVGLRSGALLDRASSCAGRWHLAPQDGPALLRDLTRIRQAAGHQRDGLRALALSVEIAGNLLSAAFLAALPAANIPVPSEGAGPRRIVRLDTDPKPADRHFAGMPLWRRAEPDTDLPLAMLLADDIADWIARCEA